MVDQQPAAAASTSESASTSAVSDWKSSPIYLALSARMSQTESTVSSLSTQVLELTNLVRAALPNVAVPPAPSSTADASSAQPASMASTDAQVAALTQQISALSTSVAQLQKLQTNSISRPNLHSTMSSGQGAIGGLNLSLGPSGMTSMAQQQSYGRSPFLNSNSPSRAHNNNTASLNGAVSSLHAGAAPHFPMRPNVTRSMSSSVVGPHGGQQQQQLQQLGSGGGVGEDGKWNAPMVQTKFNSSNPTTTTAAPPPILSPIIGGVPSRDWPSPGPSGMMTPGLSNANSNGGITAAGQGGQGGPGNGMVVTKWEHLNLKMELVRAISKYGIGPPNKIQARVLPFMLKSADIIAQAPPTQERIISYVIPAIQQCLTLPPQNGPYKGPACIIVTTTVDQAAQAHKLVRNVGGPLGIRAALATGVAGSSNLPSEVAAIQRDAVHILIGTPAKLLDVMSYGGIQGGEVRTLILDEVDQLIARTLYENVLNLVKLLPPQRHASVPLTPGGEPGPFSPGFPLAVTSPYDAGQNSPFNPASKTPFPGQPSRFGAPGQTGSAALAHTASPTIERQTCIFSNTVPTDVINFSQALQIRDPVRVLVRKEGSTSSQDSVSSITPGINLKHTYVYLTITPSARPDPSKQPAESGPGTIGSGRTGGAGGQISEESNRAKEYKLDTLVKVLDDYPLWQAVIYVGTYPMLEAVVYRLNSRSWETLFLVPDMPPARKKAVLTQWRQSTHGSGPRFLVVFDVTVKSPEIPWSPLVINFDLPRSVEIYAHRAAAAVPPPNNPRQNANANGQGQTQGGGQNPAYGVIVNFVQAAGGDVEMLRSTECAYRFKSAEIPSAFHDLFIS